MKKADYANQEAEKNRLNGANYVLSQMIEK